jgi:hypothetical protein
MTNLPTPIRYLKEISGNIEKHFGRGSFVLHEEKSATAHVDLHVVPPNPDRPYFTVLTSGMSDLDMHVPPGLEEFALAEVCLCLPSYWPLAFDRFEWREPKHFWPLNLLHLAATYTHKQNTWFCRGHTVGSVEDPKPIDPQVEFTGVLFLEPQSFPGGANQVETSDGRVINYLALIPLLPDEMFYAKQEGSEALAEKLFEAGVTELVQVGRASAVLGY